MKTILEVLGESSLRAVIIALTTACVLRVLRVKSPGICHHAWTGVLIAMLCMPFSSLWAPRIALPVLPAASIPAAERLQAIMTNTPVTKTAAPEVLPLPKSAAQFPITNPTPPQMRIYQIAGILYLAGFCVLVLKLLAGTLLSRRLAHGASGNGLILYSTQCTVPITIGLFRAHVFLPVESKDWDPAKLDAVLIHEKEHIRRRDPLVEWLALLNRCLYWFHPLSWWLCSQLSGLAEQTCDEAVLAKGHDSSTYAEHLLDFARSVKKRGALITAWGSSLHGSKLTHRIRRILTSGKSPAISRIRLTVVTILCGIAILAPSVLELARAQVTPVRKPVTSLPASNMASPYAASAGQQLNQSTPSKVEPKLDSLSSPDQALYETGTEQLKAGQYIKARLAFQTLIKMYPNSKLAAAAMLGIGDSFYGEGRPDSLRQADEQYKRVVVLFPANRKAVEAQRKILDLNYRLMHSSDREAKSNLKAVQVAQEFLQQHPDSDHVPIVRQYSKDTEEAIPGYYRKWLDEDVVYIITPEERNAFLALKNDQARDVFIEQFWNRRNPDPTSTRNAFKEEHYRRIAYANQHFASSMPGWKTDRGRIYILYGKPDKIESHPTGGPYNRPSNEGGGTVTTYPFENWWYRHIDGVGDDIEIEFVDQSKSGEYRLAMSPEEKDALINVPGAGLTSAQQQKSSGVYVMGPGVKAPVVLYQPLPPYTDEARAARVAGIILIQAIIRKDGTVDSLKVLRGLGYGLDESAINTIAKKWRFRPGTFNGEPVDIQVNIEVSFRLHRR
jgi:TonB family protein